MSGIKLANGTAASSEATIDTDGNVHVVTPTTELQAGFTAMTSEKDSGTITGSRYLKSVETSSDFRLRVGTDQVLFNHSFEGTVIAQDRLQQNLSTMTAVQGSGYLSLNNGNATASGNAANVRTYRCFPLLGSYSTYFECWVREANETSTNSISEWGLGYAAGTAAPTDGVFFRRVAGGQLQAVVNFAGSESVTNITSPTAGLAHHFVIVLHNDEAEFWIDDVLYVEKDRPTNQPSMAASGEAPAFFRVYNSGIASAGRRVEVGFLNISLGDVLASKPWAEQLVGSGGFASNVQPGTASGSLTNLGNSATTITANVTLAAGLNTAPAITAQHSGYATFAIIAGAATDYAIFGWTNPAGTVTLPGKTFYVTGVSISSVVVTALAAGIAHLQWFLGVGSTAASLATADGAATVGPRRVALGQQAYAASAAAGVLGAQIDQLFGTPYPVYPGTILHIILKEPVGTAGGLISNLVRVDGYFE